MFSPNRFCTEYSGKQYFITRTMPIYFKSANSIGATPNPIRHSGMRRKAQARNP
jgi:hypothetical protein